MQSPNLCIQRAHYGLLVTLAAPQDIIDIENVVKIFIVITIIPSRLARFRQYPTRVVDGVVTEAIIASLVSSIQVASHGK